MSTARFIVGDSLTVLRSMPNASVDVVITSPPFLALRSYLPADHPDKVLEVGSEATPADFIDVLLAHTAEWRRVLAPHGSICVELGDTYAGSGGAGGDYKAGGLRDGQAQWSGSAGKRAANGVGDDYRPSRSGRGQGWPLSKSLCMIPELYRIALVYGMNPLTGQASPAGTWRARNVVRWHRPNPPIGALGDKFRPSTSDMVIACTSRTRYFDLDATRVRSEHAPHTDNRGRRRDGISGRTGQMMSPTDENGPRIQENANGAPPLDTWVIPTAPYKGSHYATFPPALITRPVLAMCPERVCTTCGEPSRRIVETNPTGQNLLKPGHPDDATKQRGAIKSTHVPNFANRTTIGWDTCGHGTWRPGVVLDPFAGSGTTGVVALGHGRNFIGVDLDARNALLAEERIGGLFFTVEHQAPEETPVNQDMSAWDASRGCEA